MRFVKTTTTIIGLITLIVTAIFGVISIKEKFFSSYPKPELRCRVEFVEIFDQEILQTFPNKLYKNILVYEKDRFVTIGYYLVIIKNIGNKIMTFNDMHKNNPLRISMKYINLMGACIDKRTPTYIDASIDTNNKENNIFVKFDRINQNDSIFIKILSDQSSAPYTPIEVFGSSDYFSPNIKSLDE